MNFTSFAKNEKSLYLKFCKNFCIFEMAWSRAFQKCIIFHFYNITGFFDKKFKLTLPQHILVFKYPSRGRVKLKNTCRVLFQTDSLKFITIYITLTQLKNFAILSDFAEICTFLEMLHRIIGNVISWSCLPPKYPVS